MSIFERMKQDNDLREEIMKKAAMFQTKEAGPEYRGLSMKSKKPRVNKILGDANPLADEDLEALRQFIRISRGG